MRHTHLWSQQLPVVFERPSPWQRVTCQLLHQRWPSNTNYSWQQVVRQLAGIIACLLCQDKCAQRSAKKKVSITPCRGLSSPEASVPQSGETKLVSQVKTKKKTSTFHKCCWLTTVALWIKINKRSLHNWTSSCTYRSQGQSITLPNDSFLPNRNIKMFCIYNLHGSPSP